MVCELLLAEESEVVKLRQACCKAVSFSVVQPLSKGCQAQNRPRQALDTCMSSDLRLEEMSVGERSIVRSNASLLPKITDVKPVSKDVFPSSERCSSTLCFYSVVTTIRKQIL